MPFNADGTIERYQIKHLPAKPEDFALKKDFIREGAEGRDIKSAQEGEEKHKEEGEDHMVRALEGEHQRSPRSHSDNDLK